MVDEVNVNTRMLGPNPWLALAVIAVVTVGIGVWLILSRNASEGALALLLAAGLVVSGLGEALLAPSRAKPIVGYLLTALFLVGAVVVVLRPGETLSVLAKVLGVVLLAVGTFQIAGAVIDHDERPQWKWSVLAGVVTVAAGVFALVWPDVTIRVIGIIFGIRLVVVGVSALGLANDLRRIPSEPAPT